VGWRYKQPPHIAPMLRGLFLNQPIARSH